MVENIVGRRVVLNENAGSNFKGKKGKIEKIEPFINSPLYFVRLEDTMDNPETGLPEYPLAHLVNDQIEFLSPVPAIDVEIISEDTNVPRYGSELASGCDLYANITEPLTLNPGSSIIIPTGIKIKIPIGYEAQVRSRSGISTKHHVMILNGIGTIDADYRGEIKVPLINFGSADFIVEPGMRIAQMIFAPVVRADFKNVKYLSKTERGSGGFGSTGV